MTYTLDKAKLKSKGKVVKLQAEGSIRRKLMDMGIVPGVDISVTGKAPLGDPIEVFIRGYNLTLRKDEARCIVVEG